MRCKVALVPRMGEDVIVEEVELAEPRDNEVRIKVMTCTICHSDIHGFRGELGAFDGPGTAGHEVAGIVDKVGAKVTYVKPGDRVVSSLVRQGCGHCCQCLHGRQLVCVNVPGYRSACPAPTPAITERSVSRRCRGSVALPNIPTTIEPAMQAGRRHPICDRLRHGLRLYVRFWRSPQRSKIKPGESCAVVGCGGVGLSAVMGARCPARSPSSPSTRWISNWRPRRNSAPPTLSTQRTGDAVEEVKKITRGFGVDHSFVAAGGEGIKHTTFALTAGLRENGYGRS